MVKTIFYFGIFIFIVLFKIGYVEYYFSNYKKYSDKNFFALKNDKGAYGEYLTFRKLETHFPKMRLLANIYLPTSKTTTTEVDLLGIDRSGIYLFEVKNYSGAIYGDGKNKNWAQFLGKKKYNFYNPISQNQTHVNAVKRVLNIEQDYLFNSLIVFGKKAEIKKIKNIPSDVIITKTDMLKKDIKNKKKLLKREDVEKIYIFLKQYTNVSKKIKKAHIKNIQEKYSK